MRWQETPQGLESRLNGVLIDRYAEGENAGYPTLCKGRFEVGGRNLLRHRGTHQPQHPGTAARADAQLGIRAIKIEGRQRSPAYVAQVTRVWRAAIDAVMTDPDRFAGKPGLDGGPGQGGRRPAPHAGRLPSSVEMTLVTGVPAMKLALGPIALLLAAQTGLGFLRRIAAMPVDIVYLGETVCSRRHELRLADWLDLAARRARPARKWCSPPRR